MNIVILNGSGRKGNTVAAIHALTEGMSKDHRVEIVDTCSLRISPCIGCGTCQCVKGCFAKDDTNPVVDKLVEADVLIFATPVYWWGMTAQLKQVIDKCYSKAAFLKNKKAGVLVVGGAATDNLQYRLIQEQFQCMARFLNWELLFQKSFSATGKEELAMDSQAMRELRQIGAQL